MPDTFLWLDDRGGIIQGHFRGVAQLVARTAGGREVAGSSPVTPTTTEVLFDLLQLSRLFTYIITSTLKIRRVYDFNRCINYSSAVDLGIRDTHRGWIYPLAINYRSNTLDRSFLGWSSHDGLGGYMVERVERVDRVEPVADTRPAGTTVAQRIVWYIAGILLVLLAFRFVLALLGANPSNGFANFIYNVSHPFVAPFFSLFSYDQTLGTGRFEVFTLVAMAVYAVIAWGLARLFRIGEPTARV